MTDEYTLTQKAVAEFIGTFCIVFFGAGAVVIDFLTTPPETQYTEYVLSGLGHGGLGWVGIGLAFFGAVALPIYFLGHVSGQHINPAVTIAMWLTDRIDARPAVAYIVAQLAGGIAGGVVFTLIRGPEAATIGGMGATAPFPGIAGWQAALNEVVITLFLMMTIMAFAVDDRTPDSLTGLAIGFIVAIGIFTTGNISGASFNPARTIGPYVTDTLFGGPNLWGSLWIYIVGPILGAILGVYLYEWLVLDPSEQVAGGEAGRPAESPGD